jgi:hypothetical protein
MKTHRVCGSGFLPAIIEPGKALPQSETRRKKMDENSSRKSVLISAEIWAKVAKEDKK